MKHDPEHLIAVAEAQHRANKLATRRLQHRRRLEQVREPDPAPWLAAVRRDDATDPVLVTSQIAKLEEQVAA